MDHSGRCARLCCVERRRVRAEPASGAARFHTDTGESVVQGHVREEFAGTVSRQQPHVPGRTAHSILRNRPLEPRQLPGGQAPNPETQADCPTVTNFQLSQPKLDANGQALGSGCLYPPMVKTVVDQLEAAKLTWRGYMEDMGNNPARESATCGHMPPGAEERTGRATVNDKYAAKHDPFVYFHSIIDDQSRCDAHVVNLDKLPADLRSIETTPNYSFITPNLCNDGHDARCIDGSLGGFQAIDAFLQKWVPLITGSPAFQKDGLLIITFDESDSVGDDAAAACCGEQGLPGSPQLAGINGSGGGRIGAVLLSPFIEPGTVSTEPYNHYSTLRYIEDTFGLSHLGYAGQKGLKVFGSDVFTRPSH